jgi:HEAT repeat protein
VAGQRQIGAAIPAVVASLSDTDAAVRSEAARTIAIIGDDRQAGALVKLLQKTDDAKERAGIEKALLSISSRCGAKCVPHLRPLTKSRDAELHKIGLHALAVVGGPEALASVAAAVKHPEPAVQDEAVRLLSTWPNKWPADDDAGEALLTLARSAGKKSHQVLGLRGYLEYVRANKKIGGEQKAAKVKDIQPHIKRREEKLQAIAVLGEAPSAAALELLTTLADDPAVAEESYAATVKIAGRGIKGVSKDQRRQALQTVVEKSKNNHTKQKAQKALGGIK